MHRPSCYAAQAGLKTWMPACMGKTVVEVNILSARAACIIPAAASADRFDP